MSDEISKISDRAGLVADISRRLDWQVEPETEWLAEGVLLPNGTTVIVPSEGVRGVPGVLPLPPAPIGITMQTNKIQMRRQRLIDGMKILVASIPQENPESELIAAVLLSVAAAAAATDDWVEDGLRGKRREWFAAWRRLTNIRSEHAGVCRKRALCCVAEWSLSASRETELEATPLGSPEHDS